MRSLPRYCALGLLWVAVGCSLDDPSVQGARGPCGQAEGNLLGCPDEDLETPEDACWKLVNCGVIPLEHEEDSRLDWRSCNEEFAALLDYQREFAIECIEASSCDQLKTDRSPENPGNWDTALPLCMQFGDM